jgi:integrase
MPLKLVPPRAGKSPNYTVRGTYLGFYVDRSTGVSDAKTARKVLQKIERDIERGTFSEKAGPTFASAALAYMKAGGDERFIQPLLDHFKERPLAEIDQEAIDNAAFQIYPNASPATRNRQVYTPISAILKHVGHAFQLKRPKGSAGIKKLNWLRPEEAERIFTAAKKIDEEFSIFLVVLCYTGLRLSEALHLGVREVSLQESFAYIPDTKTDEPRAVFLPPVVVDALNHHPRGMDRPKQTVFRFRKNGYLYNFLKDTKKAAGEDLAWVTFHSFRHTYGTWMRQYGGLDTRGLVGTGTWKDEKSAARYSHVVVSEEAKKAMLLPTPKKARK